MKTTIVVCMLLLLSGCTTTTNYYASTDEALLVVGNQAPEGYPRTYVFRSTVGCVQTTESWRKDAVLIHGKSAWLKQVERVAIDCQ